MCRHKQILEIANEWSCWRSAGRYDSVGAFRERTPCLADED